MFLMILIGVFIGIFVRFILPSKALFPSDIIYSLAVSGIKILLLPITMGIGYEVLMLAGKHDNLFTRVISAPGLWVQRLTTKEPTLDMLEVAITSIKCALRDEYPEYMEFFNNREWEPRAAEPDIEADEAASEGAFDLPEIGIDTPIVDVATEPKITVSEADEADDTDGDHPATNEAADTSGECTAADSSDDTDENDA